MGVRTLINMFVACVLLVSLANPGSGHADSRRPLRDAEAPSDRFIEAQAERLGLDEKTREAIRTIADASRTREEALRAELYTAHAQMRARLLQDLPDEAAVMQQADTIGALELAARKNRLQAMLRIRALLTPAQRQELIQMQSGLRGRRRPDLTPECQADSVTLCPTATWRARLQCLYDHLQELSEACRAALQTREDER